MRRIILASSSKHRKKLMKQLKISFSCVSPDIDESRKKSEPVSSFVKRLSIEKAEKIAILNKQAIVIGSDEVAVVKNKILGKPITKKNAQKQLRLISGNEVNFKTGLCVIDMLYKKKFSCVVNYKIILRKLTDDVIDSYINKEDILNCAGSIKLEGLAISLVSKAQGNDPTSVIGLPLIKLTEYLTKLGIRVP
tara:strand:- start:528 stop:1106 length:579 start_codon:yes stop_codon:yes gene_type:complete